MCCFTGPIKKVTSTRIFARENGAKSQFIVYQMNLETKKDLAMVLPIPVDQSKGEDAVHFINMQDYSKFFFDLESGFGTGLRYLSVKAGLEPLKVYEVGSFEASYVPTIKDFLKLDARFRFPPNIWEKLPGYRDFGFAVFKLKSGVQTFHPMAFSFERADSSQLFFPTVHIHDGKVHETAHFDHLLYCQSADAPLNVLGWEESRCLASQSMSPKAREILIMDRHFFRLELKGRLKNKDTILEKFIG
jgi:hypothetical protein